MLEPYLRAGTKQNQLILLVSQGAAWQETCGKTVAECFWRRIKHQLHLSSLHGLGLRQGCPNQSHEGRNSAGLAGTDGPLRTGLDTPAQTHCGQRAREGHLEFHSTFCLSLRLRKPGLMRLDTQGLPLWKSHWKMRKLVTEMTKMSWLKGSMATRLCCGEIAVTHASSVTGKTINHWRDKCMKIMSVCLWPNPQKTHKSVFYYLTF